MAGDTVTSAILRLGLEPSVSARLEAIRTRVLVALERVSVHCCFVCALFVLSFVFVMGRDEYRVPWNDVCIYCLSGFKMRGDVTRMALAEVDVDSAVSEANEAKEAQLQELVRETFQMFRHTLEKRYPALMVILTVNSPLSGYILGDWAG